jgi:hypothetical protein
MATYEKIAGIEVGILGASTIDFVSIPSTFTDLKIVASLRNSGAGGPYEGYIRFNNISTSTYNDKWLRGDGASAISASDATTQMYNIFHPGLGATASTFGNLEIYVPNYSGSTQKSVSMDVVTENNATTAYAALVAGLWTGTAAINQVTLYPQSGTFVQYSSATLYGIKKA